MDYNNIKWDDRGLIPAVIQDNTTSSVLMVGYMNRDSLKITIESGEVTFFSRSKNRLWTKGEKSGNIWHPDLKTNAIGLLTRFGELTGH